MTNRLLLIGTTVGLCAGISVARGQDTTSVPTVQPVSSSQLRAGISTDSVIRRPRPHAIEYSDAYATRLTIHRIGSYLMFPLFGTEYWLGEKLINGTASHGERSAHGVVATGIGGLFAINTVTGAWNLYDSRKDPSGRTRRIVHGALMLAADAGFALAAASAGDENEGGSFGGDNQINASRAFAEGGSDDASTHKRIALTSIGISAIGTVMMWVWK